MLAANLAGLGICPLIHPKGCPTVRPPECDVNYDVQQTMAKAARDSLVAKGWKVREGLLRFASGHMYGQNPQSRYGLMEFNDTLIGDMPLWTLGPTDAIFWVGCTPPPLEYFSMRTYLMLGQDQGNQSFEERNLFASLGDAANNLRFNTTGGSSSPGNINRTASLVISGNLPSGAAVTDALVGAGLPAGAINHDWMPPSLLHMKRSEFTTVEEGYMNLFRVSLFDDAAERERYVNSTWPVYMMWAPRGVPVEPAPVPEQRHRGTGTNESWLAPAVASLASSANETMGAAGYGVSQAVQLSPIDIEGVLDCIPHDKLCGGDNRDAAYFSDRQATYTLADASSFLLVLGVNHNMSGKATYGNVVVETLPSADAGVFNISNNGQFGTDSRSFGGSFAPFTRGAQLPDALFAVAISRDCAALAKELLPTIQPYGELKSCLQMPDDLLHKRKPPLLRVVTRAYLEPQTQTGPAYAELVWPRVLRFTRK